MGKGILLRRGSHMFQFSAIYAPRLVGLKLRERGKPLCCCTEVALLYGVCWEEVLMKYWERSSFGRARSDLYALGGCGG